MNADYHSNDLLIGYFGRLYEGGAKYIFDKCRNLSEVSFGRTYEGDVLNDQKK
jgi:hypothetical protein